ncbi:helix-turn-helix transcriptional regulator [Paenibacillus sp. OV219]|uniref:helix-turn-helix transcriptional regulator n=1 Tax=Paenibacillus sp. OV219 TaxID=1884377 RepID=UPI0008B2F194|nr:LuxR C-terminal-related transcriptional regulator [Paenibacillus sp. OV219]SEN74849.1 AAA ATPase domain-containing protein [Paenibacillus sp. OV219]
MERGSGNERVARTLDLMEQHYLVGRDQEIEFFVDRLQGASDQGGIINVYGTGGIGKSYLLHEFRRLASQRNIQFLLLDCRVFPGNPVDFCHHVLRAIRYPMQSILQSSDALQLIESCLQALADMALHGKMVLALDSFESFGEMEYWLREQFLAQLHPGILVILAGRFRLQGAWLSSPGWRQLIHQLPLGDLNYDAAQLYLERFGIVKADNIKQIWSRTKGHPLTLSLLVSTTLAGALPKEAFADSEVFMQVVSTWLREVPDPDMRELVEASAVLRSFNQELLSRVLEKPVTNEQFLKLTGYSFVQRVERGWLLHDLLRDAIGADLRLRRPEYYHRIWKRCVLFYCDKMKQSAKQKTAAWENGEILFYIGNQFLQFLLYQQSISFSAEPLHPSNWAEAERYIEHRRQTARDAFLHFINRETGLQEEYILTANESLGILNQIRMKELYELDPTCVKLIRNAEGTIYGLMEIIPINTKTMNYLQSSPISAAYFNHLSHSERSELMVPGHTKAGYFVKILDVYDFSDISMMQASLFTFISHILTAGFVVAAPTENPISYAICTSLGLEVVEGVTHSDYDGVTMNRYYFMDTRGSKLHSYMSKMIASFDLPEEDAVQSRRAEEQKQEAAEVSGAPEVLLSFREQEVARLLVAGRSNKEIASELCLSEATVKKHISNIFKKAGVKNRVQLLNKLPAVSRKA